MVKRLLVAFSLIFPLAACATNGPGQTAVTSIPPTNTPVPTPSIDLTPTVESHLDHVDISAFMSAWNTHDVAVIRGLYGDSARYFTEGEANNLYNEGAIDPLVAHDAFAGQVRKYDGYRMQILQTPFGIFGKLVAYLYRWENDTVGYNGAALLRFEDGKIILHVDVVSSQQTPNPGNDPDQTSGINLDSLMKAWNDADVTAAENLYSESPVILSDEDLFQAPWRDFIHPPKLNQLLSQFVGWNPTVISEPQRVEDLVIFSWRWKIRDYPIGYGIRLLHYNDSRIVTDIRLAVRPWESNGQSFMNP